MSKPVWFLAGGFAAFIACGVVLFLAVQSSALSALAEPGAMERWAARTARSMAMPAGAKARVNPVADSPETLSAARAHWADHCAVCHANNGSGDAMMGKRMYPPAPDMRLADTQNLTDGELFYVIQNGVRFTGMPGWGGGAGHDELDSWKLVRFIRHLTHLTAEEERAMEALNPKSPDELKEEQEENDFLNGGPPHEHHHH